MLCFGANGALKKALQEYSYRKNTELSTEVKTGGRGGGMSRMDVCVC